MMTTGVLEKIPFSGILMLATPAFASGLFGMCQALPVVAEKFAFVVSSTRSTHMPSSRIHS